MSTDTASTEAVDIPAPQIVHLPSKGAIVVGVDGSPGSRAALEAACDEAQLRGLPLAAVIAWAAPEVWVTPHLLVPSAQEMHAAAIDVARAQIHEVLAARARRGASVAVIELMAASGPAPVVLERACAEATMLVIGHRGRGAVGSRLIGSVGLSAVVHAHCSVLVVRVPDDQRSEVDEHESHAT